MAQNKTKPSDDSVTDYLDQLTNPTRREDARVLLELFGRVTGMQPRLWGGTMVGFGHYHYKYESGREGDYFLTGFAPRKSAMTVYIMPGFKKYSAQLQRLGPHRHSVSCLYVTKLAAIDLAVLEEIIADSVLRMKDMYEWTP